MKETCDTFRGLFDLYRQVIKGLCLGDRNGERQTYMKGIYSIKWTGSGGGYENLGEDRCFQKV